MKLKELAEIIEKYPDVKTLAEEIKAADDKITTIGELTEYLEDEYGYFESSCQE